MLVRNGLHRISARLGVQEPSSSDRFYAQLSTHSWPGNVRELLNALERCLVHRRVDVLDAEDLDDLFDHFSGNDEAESEEPPTSSNLDLVDNEEETIRSALLSTGGNVSRVARRLGMPRTTLRRRVREYGLKHLIPSD